MKRYPEYKESDVEWLGEVPEHWSVTMLKHAALVNPTKGLSGYDKESTDQVTFLPMENVSETGHFDTALKRPICELWSGFTYFEEGDAIVAKITPCFENGKGAFLSNLGSPVGFGSTEFHVLRSREKVSDAGFLYYLTYSDAFRKPGRAFMTGAAGQQRVPSNFVEEYHVALPPLPEQRAIAAFLDRKTEQIDTLIEKKRRLIELLKEQRTALINRAVTKGLDLNVPMKDSGIEWLGEVPEHWAVTRFKFLATGIEQGWSPQCENRLADPDEWGVLKVGCVNGPMFDDTQHKALPAELAPRPKLEVRPGDLLMSRANTRELVGSISLIGATRSRLILCDKLYRIRLEPDKTDARFVVQLFSSTVVRAQIEQATSGASSSMQNISQEIVKELLLALPPRQEQEEIADYLADDMRKVDSVIDKELQNIALLRELRTALISEVVTGKIDVCQEEEIPSSVDDTQVAEVVLN